MRGPDTTHVSTPAFDCKPAARPDGRATETGLPVRLSHRRIPTMRLRPARSPRPALHPKDRPCPSSAATGLSRKCCAAASARSRPPLSARPPWPHRPRSCVPHLPSVPSGAGAAPSRAVSPRPYGPFLRSRLPERTTAARQWPSRPADNAVPDGPSVRWLSLLSAHAAD